MLTEELNKLLDKFGVDSGVYSEYITGILDDTVSTIKEKREQLTAVLEPLDVKDVEQLILKILPEPNLDVSRDNEKQKNDQPKKLQHSIAFVKEDADTTRKPVIQEEKKEDKIKIKKTMSTTVLNEPGVLEAANVSGLLVSLPTSRNIKVEQLSITLYGKQLLTDATLELKYGQRYGLIGANGSGKSTLLSAIASRAVPVPQSIDIWHLSHEAPPSTMTALEAVIDFVEKEHKRLEEQILKLMEDDPIKNAELVEALHAKLEDMDPSTFISRAGEILNGLGFNRVMMNKMTKDMSGGWRMRVSLAQALFIQPMLLLLDEPTNHLDLGACVWLEETLCKMKGTLLLISHSRDFLNGVCTSIIRLTTTGKLEHWSGNYDIYIRTRAEQERNMITKYQKEQDDMEHIRKFIASCGTHPVLVRQALSKQKILDKMIEAGLTEKPIPEPSYEFTFIDPGALASPLISFIDVAFSYSGKPEDYLFTDVCFGVHADSRIALVGPNGAGKSTLLKLMIGEIVPCQGDVKRHMSLRIGRYFQHSAEQLPMNMSPLEFMMEKFADGVASREGKKILTLDEWRTKLGVFGITGYMQTSPMKTLSNGIQTRVVFALISIGNPHVLLLDEPTNHMDMATIDSLAAAINRFPGGLVLVSHDFRLINQVAKEIWVCDNKKISKWSGDIALYKKKLQQNASGVLKK